VSPLLPWREPQLLEGPGSLGDLPALLKRQAIGKVLIVTDQGITRLGLMDGLLESLRREDIGHFVFDGTVPNPTVDNIETALGHYHREKCQAILAFGGGSPMDCAKAVGARVARPGKSIASMKGVLKVLHRLPPLIAIPTTAGTGSEATLAAVVSNPATHEKYPVNDHALIPHFAVLDPELTVKLPGHITATTGMDALTHAVEAFIGRSNTRETERDAIEATRLVMENLGRVYRNPTELAGRGKLLRAAYLAGKAFTRAYIGYVHAMAHTLGGFYGIPHGLANAVILPHMLEYYGQAVENRLARLARDSGTVDAALDDRTASAAFIAIIKAMNQELGIPRHLEGIQEADIPLMVSRALGEANPLYPVPTILGEADLLRLFDLVRGKDIPESGVPQAEGQAGPGSGTPQAGGQSGPVAKGEKKTIRGESLRYLEVDLSTQSWKVHTAAEADLRDYIGGKGLGLKFIYDRLGKRLGSIDPLGPENILAFMMGSFIGTGAPCSGRFAGITKSPLTGLMVASSCGGPFGMACKTAGWDGLLVSGKAARPMVLRLDEQGVSFEDATGLWGQETGPAQERLASKPGQGALVIGPAGENGVLYAVIRSGNRFLGRGGMGTVMGAKNLKAIVATGQSYRINPVEQETFTRLNTKAKKLISRNTFVQAYKAYGTSYSVNPGVDAGYAPVRNFRDRTDERCRRLSGEAMAERYKTSHAVCVPCSVLCGHKGTYPDGKQRHIPEYETIALWGGNILNFDPDLIGVWNDRMNELGLDTISCGATVSWAMEAAEKGLRPGSLQFGRTDNIEGMLGDIAWQRGEGAELSQGSRKLAVKYGGLDFAAQVKGLEMAAYDPRAGWGQGLNYAVANRGGCHLNAYPIALEAIFRYIPQYSTLSKVSWVAFMEDLFSATNSVQTCQFTIFGYLLEPPIAKYTPKPLLRLAMTYMPSVAQLVLDWSALSGLVSAITGRRIGMREFLRSGRRTHVLERHMNIQCGVSAADDTLPRRFLEEAATKHPVKSVVPIEALVQAYYRKKGYDEKGVPTADLLGKLGIPAL
jgi:aldehyde:ferredoxin oxidoreductase